MVAYSVAVGLAVVVMFAVRAWVRRVPRGHVDLDPYLAAAMGHWSAGRRQVDVAVAALLERGAVRVSRGGVLAAVDGAVGADPVERAVLRQLPHRRAGLTGDVHQQRRLQGVLRAAGYLRPLASARHVLLGLGPLCVVIVTGIVLLLIAASADVDASVAALLALLPLVWIIMGFLYGALFGETGTMPTERGEAALREYAAQAGALAAVALAGLTAYPDREVVEALGATGSNTRNSGGSGDSGDSGDSGESAAVGCGGGCGAGCGGD
ncbi:TIGR04222 domain-containing membrane protein [Actinokineospora sp. G85]|uniref:TIGR04222 domain-containing membrane protein n=1 Tax=Actinokineospora sp. G85 TaxID=3406626 RepID=UPI003C78E506